MKKRFLAMVLAASMVLGNGPAVFADGVVSEEAFTEDATEVVDDSVIDTEYSSEENDNAEAVDAIRYDQQNTEEAEEEVLGTESVVEVEEPAFAAGDTGENVVDSGTCGASGNEENVVWTLSGEGSYLTLTISGTGEMEDFTDKTIPWNQKIDKITTVIMHDGITNVGSYSFSYARNLKTIELPNGITRIGTYAFSFCYNLENLNLPDSVKSIETRAFWNCDSLKELDIPYGVTRIEEELLTGSLDLKRISIPGSVTSIGNRAFEDTSLQSVTIPDSVTYIGHNAFAFCDSLTSVDVSESVTYIGESSFRDCKNMRSVKLPSTLKDIEDGLFFNCSNLEELELPEGITRIGNGAFAGCTNLKGIELPDALTIISEHAFSGCSNLSRITIPDGVVNIGEQAFYNCSSLITVKILDGVTSIGKQAFYKCKNLKDIEILGSVTAIGAFAFHECSNLTSVIFHKGVNSIDESAFFKCQKLTRLNIPDGTVSIGELAFYDCIGLTELDLPDSVTNIGDSAFSHCQGLNKIELPGGLTSINDNAFSGCYNVTMLEIPDGVTRIGKEAFSNDINLNSIRIPDSVATIDELSFNACSCLYDIYYQGSEEQWKQIEIINPCWPENVRIHYNCGKRKIPKLSYETEYLTLTYGEPVVNKLTFTTDGALTYSSSNPEVATVSSTGEVQVIGAGNTTISVSSAETNNYNAGIAVYYLQINKATPTLAFEKAELRVAYGEDVRNPLTFITDGVLFFSADSQDIAQVDPETGSVTPLQAGTTTIWVNSPTTDRYEYGTSSYTLIIDKATPILQFKDSSLIKTYGEGISNELTIKTDGGLSYYSSNEDVATVDEKGSVTVKQTGTTTIRVEAAETNKYNAGFAEYTLTINKAKPTITFESNELQIEYGDTVSNPLTFDTDSVLTYISGNTAVATVDKTTGAVTVKGTGTTTITVKSAETDKYEAGSASYKLTIGKSKPQLYFEKGSLSVRYGESTGNKLIRNTDGALTYTSSDPETATVDNEGKLTIFKAGTTTIRVESAETNRYESASAEYTLEVMLAPPTFTFVDDEVEKTYGDPSFVNPFTTNSDGKITYSSNDESVATVDENGNVTITGAGKTKITARVEATDRYVGGGRQFALTVNKAETVLSFEESSITKNIKDGAFKNKLTGADDRIAVYTSSDKSVATVDADGEVRICGSGTTTITVTIPENNNYLEGTASYELTVQGVNSSITYQAKVIGQSAWQSVVKDGEEAGTTGQSLIMEAFKIQLQDADTGEEIAPDLLGVEYRGHIQNKGWINWVANGEAAGLPGKGLRIEALQLRLTGQFAEDYDIYYCLHCQNYGWLGWAKNGEESGTAGMALRVEAIRIQLLPKGSSAPEKLGNYTQTYMFSPELYYSSYVQGRGWQKEVKKNNLSGTSGESLRLEGFKIRVSGEKNLGVRYKGHVQNVGWMDWVKDGAECGQPGKNRRIEALQLELTGADKDKYDIYYCLHVQNFGWLAWAKNGQKSGSSGVSMRVEAYAIKILPKGSPKPKNWGSRTETFVDGVGATKLTLNKTKVSVKKGKTVSLSATVLPANRTFKGVTWKSSNTSVATVSGGVVIGKKKGTATITCTSNDGRVSATCTVTVTG